MSKKKRYRGHFCKVCGNILPNEKFSGKGHAAHICKKCTTKQKARKSEEIAITRIHSVLSYHNLSRDNRKMLEKYSRSKRERVRSEALAALAACARPTPAGEIESDIPHVPVNSISFLLIAVLSIQKILFLYCEYIGTYFNRII